MSMKTHGAEREELGFRESEEWKALFETNKSADSKPGSRSQSPSKQVQFDMKGSSKSSKVGPLNLDLTNFEIPGAEESRYVLTSPRSLEACARFGVKPIELLHKSYEEFIDEFEALYDTNYSHEAIYEVFQEHERQRKRKLRLCQEERERIISEQERRERDIIGDFTKRSPHSSLKDHDKQPVIRSTSSPSLHSETIPKNNRIKSSSKTPSPEHSTIRNGHEVTSTDRLVSSGRKIGKSQSFTAHDTKTRSETSDSDTSEPMTSPHVRRVRSQWSIPKTASLPSSPRLARRDSERSTGLFNRFETKKESRTMSTDCILNAVGGKRMSNKDQKIIDLMLTRHEEAQRLRKDKMMLDLAWDDQRQLENDLRQARMKQRQTELYEQYTAKDMKQMEARARREKKERKLKQEKEEAIRIKESLWEQEHQKQERTLANKIQLKRIAEAEKKRQQEEKRRQKEREDEMNRHIAYLTMLEKHEKAMRNRTRKTAHEHLKLQIQNESEKVKISEKKEERARRLKEEERSLKDQITEKHVRAIENYEEQLIRRDSEIRNSKRKKNEKVTRQREQLTRMQEELKDWQKNLKAYQEQSLKRAEAVSAMNITKKQLRTRSQLTAKNVEHAENYERVKEDEERRRKELLADISSKDQRSEMVNMEKEEVKKISREAALSSQAVRGMVKEQTFKRADGDGYSGSTDSLV